MPAALCREDGGSPTETTTPTPQDAGARGLPPWSPVSTAFRPVLTGCGPGCAQCGRLARRAGGQRRRGWGRSLAAQHSEGCSLTRPVTTGEFNWILFGISLARGLFSVSINITFIFHCSGEF